MIANILAAYGLKKSAGSYFFTKVTDAAGDHWITVHPNGPGTKGQPVLLSKGGEIKGGMGGKFNGMHISSAKGSQGDPLTRGNMELQRSKWLAAHPAPAKSTASAHVKVPKGLKRTSPSHRRGEDEDWINISQGENTFRVPRSEVTVTKSETLTNASPRLLEWIKQFPERERKAEEKISEWHKKGVWNYQSALAERNKTKWFYTPEMESKTYEKNARTRNYEGGLIEKGQYKGNQGLEIEKQILNNYRYLIQKNTARNTTEERRIHAYASVAAETLGKHIAEREKMRRLGRIGQIKKQYEQLNLF